VTTLTILPNDTVICFYHDDADGRCSAAIVRRALGASVQLVPFDYGDPILWEDIKASTKVVMVDFSLPLEEMLRVQSLAELIWIDHHKSALNKLSELKNIAGLRSEEEAACVLTWQMFFPDQPIPKSVIYLGDRDIWRLAFQETMPFSEGLRQENTDPTNDALWGPLLNDDQDSVEKLIKHGGNLHKARVRNIERQIERYSFEMTFEGHRTLAINVRGSGEMGMRIRELGYEIGYCYFEVEKNGKHMTFVTLYSDEVDVSEIASKFGGGGHSSAAGFSFERTDMPFPPSAHVVR
jgi:oligoribonuclease NrnB/cAMP/cGMP phosphodiesterase (DHH superfamily)